MAAGDYEQIVEYMARVVDLARTSEALLAALAANSALLARLERVLEVDAQLAPELSVALDSLKGVGEALERAMAFSVARYQVAEEHFEKMGDDDDAQG